MRKYSYNYFKLGQLSKEQWYIVNQAVDDIATNIKKIIGMKDECLLFDPEGSFDQDIINETMPLIKKYLSERYPEVEEDGKMYEEFLYKLDDELMALYGETC